MKDPNNKQVAKDENFNSKILFQKTTIKKKEKKPTHTKARQNVGNFKVMS